MAGGRPRRASRSTPARAAGQHGAGSLELSLRVPPATIAQLSRDESGEAPAAGVRARQEPRARHAGGPAGVHAAARGLLGGAGRVIVLRFPAAPGAVRGDARGSPTCSRTDRASCARAATTTRAGRAGGQRHGAPRPGGPRPVATSSSSGRRRAGRGRDRSCATGGRVVPNPDRLYGLMAGEMRARFVARARAGRRAPLALGGPGVRRRGRGRRAAREHARSPAGGSTPRSSSTCRASPRAPTRSRCKAWQEGDRGRAAAPRALQHRLAARHVAAQRGRRRRRGALPARVPTTRRTFVVMPPGEQERAARGVLGAARPDARDRGQRGADDTFRERVAVRERNFGRVGLGEGHVHATWAACTSATANRPRVLHQVMPGGQRDAGRAAAGDPGHRDRSPRTCSSTGSAATSGRTRCGCTRATSPCRSDVDPRDERPRPLAAPAPVPVRGRAGHGHLPAALLDGVAAVSGAAPGSRRARTAPRGVRRLDPADAGVHSALGFA